MSSFASSVLPIRSTFSKRVKTTASRLARAATLGVGVLAGAALSFSAAVEAQVIPAGIENAFLFNVNGDPRQQVFNANDNERIEFICLDAQRNGQASSLGGFIAVLFIDNATGNIVSAGVSDVECDDALLNAGGVFNQEQQNKFYKKQAFSAISNTIPGFNNPDAIGDLNIPQPQPRQITGLLAILDRFDERCPTEAEVKLILATQTSLILSLFAREPSEGSADTPADEASRRLLALFGQCDTVQKVVRENSQISAFFAALFDFTDPNFRFTEFGTRVFVPNTDAQTPGVVPPSQLPPGPDTLGPVNPNNPSPDNNVIQGTIRSTFRFFYPEKAPKASRPFDAVVRRPATSITPYANAYADDARSISQSSFNQRFSLATRRFAMEREGKKLPGLLGNKNFDAWVGGNVTFLEDGRSGVTQDGTQYSINGGAIYNFKSGELSIGVIGNYTRSDVEGAAGNFDTRTFSFGAFAQKALFKQATLTGLVIYSRANLDLLFGPGVTNLTGNVKADAVTSQLKLERPFFVKGFGVTPSLNLTHVYINQNAFQLSNGFNVTGVNGNRLSFTGGLSISKSFLLKDGAGNVTTSLGLNGFAAYNDLDEILGANGIVQKIGSLGLTISPTISFQSLKGMQVSVGANFTASNSNQRQTAINASLKLPF